MAADQHYATGKRKTAIARVWITPGSGNIQVNNTSVEEYFGAGYTRQKVEQPFAVTDTVEKFDVKATLRGGGKSAQAEALRHGISRALQTSDPELRLNLRNPVC